MGNEETQLRIMIALVRNALHKLTDIDSDKIIEWEQDLLKKLFSSSDSETDKRE